MNFILQTEFALFYYFIQIEFQGKIKEKIIACMDSRWAWKNDFWDVKVITISF